ncbi:hypothetical protein KQI41_00570 [Tissierella pigra]|uniref:Uncharacterized protein n=1 Tax=Tissierella pigra TaxID=2607614 RepID=A0A6N7XX81_9FIRM|nr:hypothetical protein [Tissierella pigra]MBU5424886.1 hypothetical protein [Tissierella pigra]MSU01174.1 hypothetical protein [Tissierella pigra]
MNKEKIVPYRIENDRSKIIENNLIENIEKIIQSGNVAKMTVDFNKNTIHAIKHQEGTVSTIKMNFNPIGQIATFTNTNITDKELRDNYVIELYAKGTTQTAIGDITGLSQAMVHNILKEAGALK